MKQLSTFLIVSLFASLSACTFYDAEPGPRGPQGPQGPDGLQGEKGDSGYVMEWENVNFTAPSYEVILSYSDFDFQGFDSDVALVYFLWGTEEVGGETVEIWRQLQQTILTQDGILQYNYDFTKNDIRLFLDATYNLDMLAAVDTDEWIVRVVVVPAEFWNNGRIDGTDYNNVVDLLGLPELDTKIPSLIRR